MSSRPQRKVWVKPAIGYSSDINVTPLVDVVLVLLIIFMVVTPLLEKDIAVQVPSTEKVEQITELPPDQIIVELEANGDVKLNSALVPMEGLVESLRTRLAPRAESDRIVFVAADDTANYGRFVTILDHAKEAGAVTLGMATEAPERE